MNKKILGSSFTLLLILFCIENLYSQERIPSPGKPMVYGFNSQKQVGSIAVNRNSEYTGVSPTELLQKVFLKAGTCTTIDNVEVKVYGWDGTKWSTAGRGLAYFDKSDSNFPMESGLLLSTGNVLEAEGPNISDAAMGGGSTFMSDPDLQALLSKQSNSYNYQVTNFTSLEFDFQPTSRHMEFKYIFASEEYPEFVNSRYNDVFGFFLSEVGSTDKTNLALLPTTDNYVNTNPIYEVSINNVNSGYYSSNSYNSNYSGPVHNSQYFIPNLRNSQSTEFDGYTVILTAKADLDPCKKYHLKIAVGNAGDKILGSGVFLESNSFQAGYALQNKVNAEENSDLAYIDSENSYVLRASISDVAEQATTIQLSYEGTAVNGVDYTDLNGNMLNNTYVVPVGQNYIDIPYKVTNKNASGKTMFIKLFCPCIGASKYAEKTITLYNPISNVALNPSIICSTSEKGSILIEVTGESNQYKYSIDKGVNWQTSNVFSGLAIGQYTIWTKEYAGNKIWKQQAEIVNINTLPTSLADQSQCDTPDFTLNAYPLGSGDTGVWSVDASTPVAGVVFEDVNSPQTNVYVPLGSHVKLKWTLQTKSCTFTQSINLYSNASTDKYKDTYSEINLNNYNNSAIELNLGQLVDPKPTSNVWTCVTKRNLINLNASSGEILFSKDNMNKGVEIFRYSVADQCRNTKFHYLHLDFISK